MYLNKQSQYTLNVPAQSISCPITVVDSVSPPTTPTITTGGACTVGQAFTLSFTSTDSAGHQLRYGIDWDNDGSIDQYVPPTGYVNSGTTQSASRTYSTSGQKTVKVVALNDQGAQSAWSSHSFSCTEASCPIGYVWDGTQCVFSACPSGYVRQGNQCVPPNQCTTPPHCEGDSLVNSCTGALISSCGWGCAAGACRGMPIPSATINAAPSLLRIGNTTVVYWAGTNVSYCSVSGNNGDSWTGISSTGKTSSAILGQTIYTLHCNALAGVTPSSIDKQVTVNIIPTFIEK